MIETVVCFSVHTHGSKAEHVTPARWMEPGPSCAVAPSVQTEGRLVDI